MGQFSLSIPAWEQTQLQDLANAGSLSGVDPRILGAIDQAESSGSGGGLNSAGYGGWFGLSPTSNYGPGSPLGPVLTGTSVADFDQQAQVAAEEFASLLAGVGQGDPLHAEYAYQQGGNAPYPGDAAAAQTEGGSIVNAAIGGAPLTTGAQAPTPQQTGGILSSGTSSYTQLQGFGAILQEIDSLMNPSPPQQSATGTILNIATLGLFQAGESTVKSITGLVIRGTFALGFIGLIYLGVKSLTQGGGSSGPGIVDSLQTQQRLGQGSRRLDIAERAQGVSETRTGQAQVRLEERGREEGRKVEDRRERKNFEKAGEQGKHVKRGKHASKSPVMHDLVEATKTVGEAAILAE